MIEHSTREQYRLPDTTPPVELLPWLVEAQRKKRFVDSGEIPAAKDYSSGSAAARRSTDVDMRWATHDVITARFNTLR